MAGEKVQKAELLWDCAQDSADRLGWGWYGRWDEPKVDGLNWRKFQVS
jgi:hypothetical protein